MCVCMRARACVKLHKWVFLVYQAAARSQSELVKPMVTELKQHGQAEEGQVTGL